MKIKSTYILAAILILAGIYFYQDPSWNGNTRLDATRAFVEQGTFSIDAYQAQPNWATSDKAFYNGHFYTDKAIGTSFFALLPYFLIYKISAALGIALRSSVIKHVLTALVMGSAFLVNGLVMYKTAQAISQNAWKALIATLAVSLGTMLWPYSAVYYGHVPAAMFLFTAFYLLFSMAYSPDQTGFTRFLLAGLSLGFAFITDYTTAPTIAALLLYAAYIVRKQGLAKITRYGLGGTLGSLIPLSIMFIYNDLVYGTPFTFGYSHQYWAGLPQGNVFNTIGTRPDLAVLYHITFDPQFGLFWQSPVLFLALAGYWRAFRNSSFRAEGLVSAFAVINILLINSAIIAWWGGHAFGPRYLIIALPFFIVPLALLPDSIHWATVLTTLVSIIQMLIPLMGQVQVPIDWIADHNQFWISLIPFEGFTILWNYGLPYIFKTLQDGNPSWTLGYALRFLPYRLYLSLPIFLGLEAALIGLFHRTIRRETQSPGQNLAATES